MSEEKNGENIEISEKFLSKIDEVHEKATGIFSFFPAELKGLIKRSMEKKKELKNKEEAKKKEKKGLK